MTKICVEKRRLKHVEILLRSQEWKDAYDAHNIILDILSEKKKR